LSKKIVGEEVKQKVGVKWTVGGQQEDEWGKKHRRLKAKQLTTIKGPTFKNTNWERGYNTEGRSKKVGGNFCGHSSTRSKIKAQPQKKKGEGTKTLERF